MGKWSALFFSLILAGCGGGGKIPVNGEHAPALGTDVDALVLQYLQDNDIPGATVAVSKNQRLVLWKGYGWADKENAVPMQPWHRTRIGSTSKVLGAIAILQLVEEGQLALDQPLYAGSIQAFWDRDGQGPFFISSTDGALKDLDLYLQGLKEAPQRLAAQASDPDTPAYLLQGDYENNLQTLLNWASRIQIRHALSHTAGFIRSGDVAAAEAYWGKTGLNYAQLHAAMLAGIKGPPLSFVAGTSYEYSNHGFGVLGQVIEDRSGLSYHDYVQTHLFEPLGLQHVVAMDVFTSRDAVSYDEQGAPISKPAAPSSPPPLGLAAGGWAASAYDLARILCALDRRSDHLRLLDPDTVDTMSTPAFPMIDPQATVLGWDSRSAAYDTGVRLTKNGRAPSWGGASRVGKYMPLPSENAVVDNEINVAVLFNIPKVPSVDLLDEIAALVRAAQIADSYDLFDPDYPCRRGLPLSIGDGNVGRPT